MSRNRLAPNEQRLDGGYVLAIGRDEVFLTTPSRYIMRFATEADARARHLVSLTGDQTTRIIDIEAQLSRLTSEQQTPMSDERYATIQLIQLQCLRLLGEA